MSCHILESERLILRPPRPADIQAMTVVAGRLCGVARIWRACRILIAKPMPRISSPSAGAHGDGHYCFTILRKDDGVFLGGIGLHLEDGRLGIRLLAGQAVLGPGLCHRSGAHGWSQFAFDELDAPIGLGRLVSRQSGLRPCAGQAGGAPQWQPDARLPRPGACKVLCHEMLLTRADFLRKQAA